MEHRPITSDYPNAPGFKARDTAQSAAEQAADKAPRLRCMCLNALLLAGPLTADECAENLGEDRLSIRPRFSELAALGQVADSGQRRRNDSGRMAIVWRAL